MVRAFRPAPLGLVACALLALGGECSGGGAKTRVAPDPIANADARCVALPEAFPPGFAFVPGTSDRLVVASLGTTPTLTTFDVDSVPPEIPAGLPVLGIPPDSDGDGLRDAASLFLDDVFVIDAALGFATASRFEEVIVFEPRTSTLKTVEVDVPASLTEGDYDRFPDPGQSGLRTAISTSVCVRPPEGALDSRGEPFEGLVVRFCDPDVPSFRTEFTSGAALMEDQLFVSTSNFVTIPFGPEGYLPGTVLVYEFDRSLDPPRVRPSATRPVIFTSGFNPTHVQPLLVGERYFVLVTLSGALDIAKDDPSTPVIESAGVALTPAAVDVIDAATLEIVATIPLGVGGPAFSGLALDPSGRVGVIGSVVDRMLLTVDLEALKTLPEPPVLQPVLLEDAVVFDANAPLRLPALEGGAPVESCPGQLFGTTFDATGTRLLAADFCDGTLTLVDVDLGGVPTTAELRRRFAVLGLIELVAPLRADTLGLPRTLGRVAVRLGLPGVDFSGPDVFFTVNQDEGLLCGIRLESL